MGRCTRATGGGLYPFFSTVVILSDSYDLDWAAIALTSRAGFGIFRCEMCEDDGLDPIFVGQKRAVNVEIRIPIVFTDPSRVADLQ